MYTWCVHILRVGHEHIFNHVFFHILYSCYSTRRVDPENPCVCVCAYRDPAWNHKLQYFNRYCALRKRSKYHQWLYTHGFLYRLYQRLDTRCVIRLYTPNLWPKAYSIFMHWYTLTLILHKIIPFFFSQLDSLKNNFSCLRIWKYCHFLDCQFRFFAEWSINFLRNWKIHRGCWCNNVSNDIILLIVNFPRTRWKRGIC